MHIADSRRRARDDGRPRHGRLLLTHVGGTATAERRSLAPLLPPPIPRRVPVPVSRPPDARHDANAVPVIAPTPSSCRRLCPANSVFARGCPRSTPRPPPTVVTAGSADAAAQRDGGGGGGGVGGGGVKHPPRHHLLGSTDGVGSGGGHHRRRPCGGSGHHRRRPCCGSGGARPRWCCHTAGGLRIWPPDRRRPAGCVPSLEGTAIQHPKRGELQCTARRVLHGPSTKKVSGLFVYVHPPHVTRAFQSSPSRRATPPRR